MWRAETHLVFSTTTNFSVLFVWIFQIFILDSLTCCYSKCGPGTSHVPSLELLGHADTGPPHSCGSHVHKTPSSFARWSVKTTTSLMDTVYNMASGKLNLLKVCVLFVFLILSIFCHLLQCVRSSHMKLQFLYVKNIWSLHLVQLKLTVMMKSHFRDIECA